MVASVLVALLVRRIRGPRVRAVVALVVIALLMHQSWTSQRPWRADRTLWERAVRVEPKAYRSQYNLSEVQIVDGQIDEGAWHRLLAEYILDSFPHGPDWDRVEALERLPVRVRILEAAAVLAERDPCGFANHFLAVMDQRVPGFARMAGPPLRQRYGGCVGAAPPTGRRRRGGRGAARRLRPYRRAEPAGRG